MRSACFARQAFMPYFDKMPASSRLTPQFNAVWPPNDKTSASGLSFSITDSTYWGFTGKRYTLSAERVSVCIVATFGFTSILCIPSSRTALRHWLPE